MRLHSLQKGPREKDLYTTGADSYITNLGAHCQDFADTAAAIEHLDLIVMTDSSVAHLAASLGKPVINLLQCVPYWLYALEDTSTPWYLSMTLIKQPEPGDWDTVFDRLKQHIRQAAQRRRVNRQQHSDTSSLLVDGSKQHRDTGKSWAGQTGTSLTCDATE